MRFLFLCIITLLGGVLFAQAPSLIPYQAVARDASGQALNDATINARFTIHDGTATGTAVWQELQTVTTSGLGLFTVQLGSSVPLTGVNWANGSKFMQVEIDLGQGFVDIGTQQMLSVPYALHAGSVSLNVSATGDTLFVGNGEYVIIPGISAANSNGGGTSTGTSLHSCGAPNVHNPDLTYGTMTDQEGNVYKTIVIGTQEWMAENLNTSIYRNGDALLPPIFLGTDQPAYTHYADDPTRSCPFGKLYNWYACTDQRELCPNGWHIPTLDELNVLVSFLDPNEDIATNTNLAGSKMQSTGTIEQGTGLWNSLNSIANNSSGFGGLPGGYFDLSMFNTYGNLGLQARWWSSTSYNETLAHAIVLYDAGNSTAFREFQSKLDALSVRCLRD